jgi:outer membrane protein assembly factor BamA
MELTQAERLLNDHSFLRKSQISLIDACNDSDKKQLKVETWDTWSLLPSISFGRRAGNNKFGFGFKEDNFLGLGIHAGIQYKKDHLRSGYQLDFRIPLNIAKLSTLALEFTDNDDGRKTYLSYSKPFYQQSSKQQYLISTLTDKRLDSIHQNGELAWQFSHKTEQTEFAYGHLMAYTSAGVIRAHFGITKEQHLLRNRFEFLL